MKNVIKKIAASVMAFTLLGTGTAITKTVSPKSDTTIVANAACNHNCGRYEMYSTWRTYGYVYKQVRTKNGYVSVKIGEKQCRTVYTYCNYCNQSVGQAYLSYRTLYY